jgi:hypothetical protein
VICKYCQTEIADKALICYRCGRSTSEPRVTPPIQGSIFERRRRSLVPVIVAVVILLVLAVLGWWLWSGPMRHAMADPWSGTNPIIEESHGAGVDLRLESRCPGAEACAGAAG